MADDLTFGVKLEGDGSSLRGEIVASREEFERLKTAAGGTKGETDKLNTSTEQLARQQHSAAASGKSLSESGGQVAAELLKAASAAMAYEHIIVKSIQASNEYTAAIMGLASAARYSGEDIDATLNKATALTADGLMSTSEAALALKNLLSRGFTADQAIEMINRLKDSAAFGRQASLEFGQAVVSATEGIKNENSILVDNAGVTKNVSVMWKEYAAQIGVTVDSLSQAQKREAEYSGLMRETEGQMGNSALAADSLMGATARMHKATNDAAIALGQSLTPAATALADGLAWASENAIKPMIFGIQGIGIFAGVATGQVGALVDFLTSPTKWNTAGIANYRKEMRELGELGDQMATELAAKMSGAVQAPNIGKDTGARRQDVVTPDAGSKKLLEDVKRFDEKIVDLHKDTFTKDYEQWVEYENKLIKEGERGAKARLAHEAALTPMLEAEAAKRIAADDKEIAKRIEKADKEAEKRLAIAQKLAEKQAEQQHKIDAELMNEQAALAETQARNVAAPLEGDARVEAEKAIALASEQARFQIKAEAMNAETEKMIADGSLTEQIAIEQSQRREILEQQHQANLTAIENDAANKRMVSSKTFGVSLAQFEKMSMTQRTQTMAAGLMQMTAIGAQNNRTLFEINKIASIANATISGVQAVQDSYKFGATWGGPAGGAAMAAIAFAATAANISAINSTSFGGGAPSAGGGGVPSLATAPGVPVSPQPSFFDQNQSQSQNQIQPLQISIYNTGNVLSDDYIENNVISKIQDVIQNKDVLIIDPRSRQAQLLQGTGAA